MVAEHVELALFEQSLGNIEDGLNRPFGDRVADAAEKTAGSVRIDGDTCVQRMAESDMA